MTTAAETFESIMHRNNTTLPQTVQKSDRKDMVATTNTGTVYKTNTLLIATFSLVLCFCLLSTAGAASVHKRRSIASATEIMTTPLKTCHQNTPCGWAIYIPFIRRIDYFMKNTCECNPTLACLKTDDDLSVNAYVYRCKTRPTLTTTDVMPTTIN